MSLAKAKLQKLVENAGFTDELVLLQASIADSLCDAICMNEDCSHIEQLEKDQDQGWCPECGTNSMKSCLVLAGII